MKARISALMDGELERGEAAGPLEALKAEGDARDAWRLYHLIGDSMRDTRMLSGGFAQRVNAKIADEPAILAPSRRAAASRPRWQWLPMAASFAAVAMVGSLWFMQQEGTPETLPVARQEAPKAAPAEEMAQVAPPEAAHDYLLAHQGYSPRNSLQGVAPYVRMVSGNAGAARK